MLELRNVSKSFASGVRALSSFSIKVGQGETVALVGPSGCGKTTALRLCNGLTQPDGGHVLIAGKDLQELDITLHRRATGYVIQEVGLLPHWTVRKNIATVPVLLGASREELESRVERVLASVGLGGEYLDRFPAQLSGGQRQRVGVARALVARPKLLLMDEPFGALDPVSRLQCRRLVKNLTSQQGTTTLLVTHDLADALALADRIAVLKDGQLVQLGSPEALRESSDAWIRAFFGDSE